MADSTDRSSHAVLDVRDLNVEFATRRGRVRAVNGLNIRLAHGEALGVLGESGSGKSVTAAAIMGLLDSPPARIRSESVQLNGREIGNLTEPERRKIIGSKISMVFQDALTALNPVHPVGRQIAELYRVHRGMSRRDAKNAAIGMMDKVKIPSAASRAADYPHQFSGGMRQRIVIAMALALDPDVLIADEPTTALDVTVQAQILELLKEQQAELDMGLILITHDISVVSEVTDRVAVMYAGRVVEHGPTRDVLNAPAHPYSRGLAASATVDDMKGRPLPAIPGQPPDLGSLPNGCAFAPRCSFAEAVCSESRPPLEKVAEDRSSACFFSADVLAEPRGHSKVKERN